MGNVFKNAEGYLDLTAGLAIKNADKKKENSDIELYSIVKLNGRKKGHGVLLNKHSNYYTMLFVFEEKDECTSSSFEFSGKEYWFDSGRLNYVYFDDIGSSEGILSSEAIDDIKKELVCGLGLERTEATTSLADVMPDVTEKEMEKVEVVPAACYDMDLKIAKLEAERDAYKELCLQMMRKTA